MADECQRGDFDGIGGVDLLDVPAFVDALLTPTAPCPMLADMNQNGIVDGNDIQPFVNCMMGMSSCGPK